MKKVLSQALYFLSIPICLLLWLVCYTVAFEHRFFTFPYAVYILSLLMLGISLIGLPLLVILIFISYNSKSHKFKSTVLICFVVQIILTIMLVFFDVNTKLPESNKILYAKPMSAEQMSQHLNNQTPGLYFITTWVESGTVPSEGSYIAAWLDFPSEYNITTEMYYYYNAEKTPNYPPDLVELLDEQEIIQLPTAIYISNTGSSKMFQDISWHPILQSEDENSLSFKQFIAENFDKKHKI